MPHSSSDLPEFGAATAWNLEVENIASMVIATRMELRPNDIIVAAEQPVT